MPPGALPMHLHPWQVGPYRSNPLPGGSGLFQQLLSVISYGENGEIGTLRREGEGFWRELCVVRDQGHAVEGYAVDGMCWCAVRGMCWCAVGGMCWCAVVALRNAHPVSVTPSQP